MSGDSRGHYCSAQSRQLRDYPEENSNQIYPIPSVAEKTHRNANPFQTDYNYKQNSEYIADDAETAIRPLAKVLRLR